MPNLFEHQRKQEDTVNMHEAAPRHAPRRLLHMVLPSELKIIEAREVGFAYPGHIFG